MVAAQAKILNDDNYTIRSPPFPGKDEFRGLQGCVKVNFTCQRAGPWGVQTFGETLF